MSSSRYLPYVAFVRNSGEQSLKTLLESEDIKTISFSHNQYSGFIDEYQRELRKVDKGILQGILVRAFGVHSCRETMLDSLNALLELLPKIPTEIGNFYVYVLYEKESSKPLTESHRKAILAFFGKVKTGFDLNYYNHKNPEEGLIISYRARISRVITLWQLSYILWIIRHEEFLNHLLDVFSKNETVSMYQVYEYLARAFLEKTVPESSYNRHNHRVGLSLFAYANLSIDGFENVNYKTGPVHGAFSCVSFPVLVDYILTFFLPKLGPERVNMVLKEEGIPFSFKSSVEKLLKFYTGANNNGNP